MNRVIEFTYQLADIGLQIFGLGVAVFVIFSVIVFVAMTIFEFIKQVKK